MHLYFTDEDLEQIGMRGLTPTKVRERLENFQTKQPYVELIRPCSIGDGILHVNHADVESGIATFNRESSNLVIVKFVPASGAATRMFSDLQIVRRHLRQTGSTLNDSEREILDKFISNLPRFPFYEPLRDSLSRAGFDLHDLVSQGKWIHLLDYTVTQSGLNLANLPKALIPFHTYPEGRRTAFDEHLFEALEYSHGLGGISRLHMTIQKKFRVRFIKQASYWRQRYGIKSDSIQIEYSYQEPSTDTIAVDLQLQPVRDFHGHLVFRPGGHGSLLQNLHNLDADLVFIKNIDNVVKDPHKEVVVRWQKFLGGMLLNIRDKVFKFLSILEGRKINKENLMEIAHYLENTFHERLPHHLLTENPSYMREFLFEKLNRPIRVCGMVALNGPPGGGPFWVRDGKGNISKQIVESAQINLDDTKQRSIWESSSFYNPVEIALTTRDYKGGKHDLKKYVDPEAVIITRKWYQGREIMVLEHPGLWNGSMADWLTVFVEVPAETFQPVKTLFDLLGPAHQ